MIPTPQTPLQSFQQAMFDLIDEAARELHEVELDALRQIVKYRIDRIADEALAD